MQIYQVGGAVRDQLLGRPVTERDWVVVGATPEQMRALGFRPVGKDFPVFLHPRTGEEYALARTERKTGHGYGGFTFYTSPDVTLEQDLIRRDLTVNAMAMDDQGTLYDPYGGQADLHARLLRHVSPAFAEDPLRVLRVARFAARYAPLGFQVAPQTRALMRQLSHSGELQHLSAERCWKEIERALGEPAPQRFIEELQQCDALTVLMPELAHSLQQHPERMAQLAQSDTLSACQRFALLTLDLPPGELKPLCQRIKTPNDWFELARLGIRWQDALKSYPQLDAEQRLQLLEGLDLLRRPERFEEWLALMQARYPELPASLSLTLRQHAERIRQINPQPWVQAGLKGAEIGKALRQARLEQLQ